MSHKDDILTEKIPVKNGYYSVPEFPGLGINVDDEKLNRYVIN